MCVIIWKPEGAYLDHDHLKGFLSRNGDGVGIFYPTENGKVKAKKFVEMDEDGLIELYEKHKNQAFALHMRLATHGLVDMENTHPYKVLSRRHHGVDVVMAHNGTFGVKRWQDNRSDSWHLVRYFIKPILEKDPDIIFRDSAFKQYLGELIGTNKLLFMNGDGLVSIVNEHKGDREKDGIWYSNKIGMYSKQRTTTSYSHAPSSYSSYYGSAGAGSYTRGRSHTPTSPSTTSPTGAVSSTDNFVKINKENGKFVYVPRDHAIRMGYLTNGNDNSSVASSTSTTASANSGTVDAEYIGEETRKMFRELASWDPNSGDIPDDDNDDGGALIPGSYGEDQGVLPPYQGSVVKQIAGELYQMQPHEILRFVENRPDDAAGFLCEHWFASNGRNDDFQTIRELIKADPQEVADEIVGILYNPTANAA